MTTWAPPAIRRPLETQKEPSKQRVDPQEALGDGPVMLGPDVEPEDVDL